MTVVDSRARVLARVRDTLARSRTEATVAEAEQRLAQPAPNRVPARGRVDPLALAELFISESERIGATAERVANLAEVPARVRDYLVRHNLPATVRIPPEKFVKHIPWSKQQLLTVEEKPADGGDYAAVTGAFAAIAETGTLMLVSGAECTPDLHFLASTHIAIIPHAQICGTYEQAWARLRNEAGKAGGFMPRAVNWITGPSRTADIEQTLLMGAHGPMRLHIIVVDEGGVGDGEARKT